MAGRMSTSVSPENQRRRALLEAISVLSVLFVGLHQTYVRLADWMHGLSPATEAERVTKWMRPWVVEHDGRETVVMMVIVTAFMLAAFAIVCWLPKIPWFPWWPVQAVCVLSVGWVLQDVSTSNWNPVDAGETKLLVAALGLVTALIGWIVCRFTERWVWLGRGLLAIAAVMIAAWVLISPKPAWSWDYGYFIGPANKLAQGEPLGSFYLQYNLIQTYLFRLMIGLGFRLHQMQAVLGLMVVLWFGLYLRLATRLIESRFLVFLFIVVLFLVRVVAIDGGPTFYPQVGPLRMDLWVVLALVLDRFGVDSPKTAWAFALVYVADNVFGLTFFAFYGVVLAATVYQAWKAGTRPKLAQLAALGAPLLLALSFQLWFFQSITNPAGKAYQNVHLGFLPISLQSMFWVIMWMVLLAFGPISLDSNEKRRATSLFLFPFAAAMFIYFYGRSHDHNLLNVSGIWALILFVALDRLRGAAVPKFVAPLLAVVVLLLSLEAVWKEGEAKWAYVKSRASRGVLLEQNALDLEIDAHADVLAPWRGQKVFLFSVDEAYFNYRFGLPQQGYFAPFFASIFAEATAKFLVDQIGSGTKVLLLRTDPGELLTLNTTEVMTASHQRFQLAQPSPGPVGPWTVFEVQLVR